MPRSKPKAIQELVDNLHISRIETRDEDSLDVKAYTHPKVGWHLRRVNETMIYLWFRSWNPMSLRWTTI